LRAINFRDGPDYTVISYSWAGLAPGCGQYGLMRDEIKAMLAFDLIGGCAEPFYRDFLSSPSHELRGAALDRLELIRSRHLSCKAGVSLRSGPTAIPKITDN
jgi:hypothetical protein